MSTFDPETGARIRAQAPAGAAQRRRNPYEAALAATWITAGLVALVLVLSSAASAGEEPAATGPAPLLTGAVLLFLVALTAGVAHLAVRAVGWRPPEG